MMAEEQAKLAEWRQRKKEVSEVRLRALPSFRGTKYDVLSLAQSELTTRPEPDLEALSLLVENCINL
jgi:hypothetical protein